MPELYAGTGRLAHVGSYHLYVMHDGRLVMSSGRDGIKLVVTSEQAREILDMLLVLARYFSGETQPLLTAAAGVNGHAK